MAIYKYTVANREGKKLSGTVEAPDETTARKELNNLGFSILLLQESPDNTPEDNSVKKFIFEAVDKNSRLVSGTIPASNENEALERLETEYSLTITAIWDKNAGEKEIEEAKQKGSRRLQERLKSEVEYTRSKNLEAQKEEEFVKTKIETVLTQVNEILQKFDQTFDQEQKSEIHKRINKLLRIKNSTNFDYILLTAYELLQFLEKQENKLAEKGYKEKEFELKIKTKRLLDELNKSEAPQTISEDIVKRINEWELHHRQGTEASVSTKIFGKILHKIKTIFQDPLEIVVIKDQIKVYNKQLWEFIKLYFKEPTPEYKDKVKKTISTIWRARKKAKSSLHYVKKIIKDRKKQEKLETSFSFSILEEINSLTGWLLLFYIMYYFSSLYLNTKAFGFQNIPAGFHVYDSRIFKYLLVIIFLAHSCSSLKINFFQKNKIANIILPVFFISATIITLLNF